MRHYLSVLGLAGLLAGLLVIGGAIPVAATCTPNWHADKNDNTIVQFWNGVTTDYVSYIVGDQLDGCGHIKFSSFSTPTYASPHWAYAGLQVFENGRGILDGYAFNGNDPPLGIEKDGPVWACHVGSDYTAKDNQTQKGYNYLYNTAWTPAEPQGRHLLMATGATSC